VKICKKVLEILKNAVPLHPVISFSVINYVVSMRGPHGSGDNLFFCIIPFPMKMKDKTIFITGAGSGIGAACAMRFASEGCRLILNARNTDRLGQVCSEVRKNYGADVLPLPFDVRDRKAIEEALASLPDEWKAIDVLVNNAGLALGLDKEFEGSLDDWETVIDTNIKGTLAMTRLVVPGMLERGRGHIINIGSIAGDGAYPGGSVYCATKAAVKALTDGLRIDLVDTPLRVTNIKPGQVETNFSLVRFHGDKDRADKVYEGYKPLEAADIAETVWFAVSLPEHVQIAEMLVLPTCQATSGIIHKNL